MEIKLLVKKFQQLLKTGFVHLFFSNFLIQFMVFGSQMLVAGLLTPKDLGRIKMLQTFIDVATIVGGGGLIVAILKLIPENSNVQRQKTIFSYVLKNTLLFSIIVFAILNTLSFFGLLSSDNQINDLFHGFSFVIIISPISLMMVRYYQARELFKTISIIQIFTKTISIIIILVLTYYFSLKGYLYAFLIGYFITFLYLFFDLKEHIVFNNQYSIDISLNQEIKEMSRYNFFGQVSDQLRIYAGLFVANYFIADRTLFGQYSFALILIQGLGVLSSSVQQFLIPKFSKLSINKKEFLRELKKHEKNYFSIALVLFVIAQLLVPFAITVLFGNKYDEAIPFIRVLLFGWLVYSTFTLIGPAFIGMGRLDISFKISLYVLLISIPILIVLCNYYGVWGVVVGYVVQAIINMLFAKRFIKSL